MKCQAIVVSLALAVLGACAGEAPREREPAPKNDTPAPTESKKDDPVQQFCTEQGLAMACHIVTGAGCEQGACYVIKDVGSACLCNPGGLEMGEPCNTTSECAPGNVCAGTTAPGLCRLTCRPELPDCPDGSSCIAIKGVDGAGYCHPQPAS